MFLGGIFCDVCVLFLECFLWFCCYGQYSAAGAPNLPTTIFASTRDDIFSVVFLQLTNILGAFEESVLHQIHGSDKTTAAAAVYRNMPSSSTTLAVGTTAAPYPRNRVMGQFSRSISVGDFYGLFVGSSAQTATGPNVCQPQSPEIVILDP